MHQKLPPSMKNASCFTNLFRQFLSLIILCLVFACEEDAPSLPANEWEHLVSYEKIASIDANQLRGVAQIFQPSFDRSYIKYNSDVYSVTFQSEYQGEEIITSGLICIPSASQSTAFPVLLGFHPSIGSQEEAPTSFSGNIQSGLELFSSVGYITLIPDYIGYGSSASIPHPYFVQSAMNENTVDMMMALTELLEDLEQEYQQKISMIGYSQGGYNTMSVLSYFERTEPLQNWEVVAAAAGGAAFDLNMMREQIFENDTYGSPESIAFLIYAYHEYYDLTGGFDQYFQQDYADFVATAFGNDLNLGQIKGQLTHQLDQLLQEEFLTEIRNNTNEAFNDVFAENSIEAWQVQTPLHIYHATKDSVISIENSKNFIESVESQGSTQVTFTEMTEVTNHTNAGAPMLLDGILWLLSFQDL